MEVFFEDSRFAQAFESDRELRGGMGQSVLRSCRYDVPHCVRPRLWKTCAMLQDAATS